MKTKIYIGSIIIATILLIISCASYKPLSRPEKRNLETGFRELLRDKERQQQNSAYLVQVKLKTPDVKKKFKLEIYCQGDSISFYSPGFLGRGTFKGIIYGDSLSFYLPSEKAYYRGLWHDLTEPDLKRWGDVFQLAFDLFKGDFLPEEHKGKGKAYDLSRNRGYDDVNVRTGKWDCHFLFKAPTLKKAVYGWSDDILLFNLWVIGYEESFPYFNLDRAYVHYDNNLQRQKNKKLKPFESDIRLDFIRQKYNIEIPPEKFRLDIPVNAERIGGLILE